MGTPTISREDLQLASRRPHPRCSGREIPTDVLRSLVVAQAKESRVAQFVVGRPLGEADLRDEFRLHPMDPASGRDTVAPTHTRSPSRFKTKVDSHQGDFVGRAIYFCWKTGR
jgi:hypothetical protein